MKKCALYRHFDAAGSLLYLGISIRPGVRLAEHMTSSAWADQIAAITIEWLPDQEAASAAERAAISAERPIHNRAHSCGGLNAVADILGYWPSRVIIAAELGVPPSVAHAWFQRGSSAPKYWQKPLQSAERHDIALTADDLVIAHAAS